jgi:hypothetical protein
MTSEQRPPANNNHYFCVPRVVIVHRFDCIRRTLLRQVLGKSQLTYKNLRLFLKICCLSIPYKQTFEKVWKWNFLARIHSLNFAWCPSWRSKNHPTQNVLSYLTKVKLELTTTSEQQPPVRNDRHIEVPFGTFIT